MCNSQCVQMLLQSPLHKSLNLLPYIWFHSGIYVRSVELKCWPCCKGIIANIVGVHNINHAWCEDAIASPQTACTDLTLVGKTFFSPFLHTSVVGNAV